MTRRYALALPPGVLLGAAVVDHVVEAADRYPSQPARR